MRSTFKVLFYLKKNAPKKNGFVPVMARITVDGTIAQFSCKLDVDPGLWDTKSGKASGRSEQSQQTNRFLDKIRVGVNKHYQEIIDKDGCVTAEKVKNAFLGLDMKCETLLKIFERHNNDFSKQVEGELRSRSTYLKYSSVYKHVKEVISFRYNRSDLALKELTSAFIIDFELFLRTEKKLCNNSVWIYMMPLRRMITIAMDNGWLNRDPFFEYSIACEETDREFLTKDEIGVLMDMKFRKKKRELVRDLFIFCCFCGLAFTDLRSLTKDNIRTSFDGHKWIIKRRDKTGVSSNVRLLDIPLKIIEKYEGMAKGNKLLPVPVYATAEPAITAIAKECGIKKHVTWHVRRHSNIYYQLKISKLQNFSADR